MKKILAMFLVMTLVLTACGSKPEEDKKDDVVEETTSGPKWFENGNEAILVNEGVISFDLEDQYFDAAFQKGEEYATVVYNGGAYAAVKIDGDKLVTYAVPEEGKELDESTAKEYTGVEKDYITKDVSGPDLSSIKKALEDSKVIKAKKVVGTEETFVVTVENNETKEVSEVTLDKEFNVK